MRRLRLLPLVCAGLVLAPGHAAAANPDLAAARERYEALRYDEAVVKATRAIARPGNSARELADAYELLGLCYSVLADPRSAAAAFDQLLALDPEHALPRGTSPKLTEALEAVRRERSLRPSLALEAPPRAAPGAVEVQVLLRDPQARAATVVALSRPGGNGQGRWHEARLACEAGRCSGAAAAPDEGEVLLYLEARDDSGVALSRVASPEAPMVLVLVRSDPAWYQRWWVWAAVGVAAGGTIAAVALAGDDPAPPPSGSWGTLRF